MKVAVIGIPDQVMGERTVACIKLKPGATATAEDIQQFCKVNLANYKIPDKVVFLEEFPTTASGKIRKIDLKDIISGQNNTR